MLSLVYCAVGVVGVVRIFGVSGFNSISGALMYVFLLLLQSAWVE